MHAFRVATVNVHSFDNPVTCCQNIEDLVKILKPLNLDLICVQEIWDNEKWKNFCSALSMDYSCYGAASDGYLGNGIASRHRIEWSSNHVSKLYGAGGFRSLLRFRLDSLHPFTRNRVFAVTHLDYLNEENRLKQIDELQLARGGIDILLGDFNSLTRADYTDTYFDQIVKGKRVESDWELPIFDVTTKMTTDFGFLDIFREKNPSLRDKHVVTCSYGTRIDYIFVKPDVEKEWKRTECSIVDTKGATDHQAVFATFQR